MINRRSADGVIIQPSGMLDNQGDTNLHSHRKRQSKEDHAYAQTCFHNCYHTQAHRVEYRVASEPLEKPTMKYHLPLRKPTPVPRDMKQHRLLGRSH
jgi:hypothetical protein